MTGDDKYYKMKTELGATYGMSAIYQSTDSVKQDLKRQDFNYKVLVDGEVIFATDDYHKALNYYTQTINEPEPIYLYEVNLVANLRWICYTEQGERVEGKFK